MIIESNSAIAVSLLSEECIDLHLFSHLVRGIKNIIALPMEIRWKHILRKVNQLVGILAKESTLLFSSCKIHDVVSSSISFALLADRRGNVFSCGF